MILDSGLAYGLRYKAIAGSDAENWEHITAYTSYSVNDSTAKVLWSNHDIPNGSATATDIYFYGSKYEPGGSEEPDTPPLVIGADIRITEGMTIRNGVLHRIVLS